MKQQDIDKKIGMPDVDAEWARFEREVIDQKTTSRKPLYWGIGIAASIALVTGIFLLNHDAEKQQTIAQQTTHTTETPTAADHHTNVDAADEPVALPKKAAPVKIETEQRPRAELLAQAKAPSAEAEVFDCVETMPMFPGGDRALMEFIKANMRYPDLAMEYGTSGRVVTTFKIDSLGYASNFKVLKIMKLEYDTLRLSRESADRQQQLKQEIEQQLGEESLRILSLMPRWTPGRVLGRSVSMKYCLPVQFRATEEERQAFLAQRQNEKLQGRITGLTLVPSSADLGPNAVRVGGDCSDAQEGKKDSVLVIVNGQPVTMPQYDQMLKERDSLYRYFFDRHQFVDSIKVLKDEAARAAYGVKGKNCKGIVKITTTPFTPVSQLTAEQLKERRLAYLKDCYRKGFSDDARRDCFAPDLYDTPAEERLFGLLAQQHGRLRREYFGPVGRDAHGVYVPLIREAVLWAYDPTWIDKSGKIATKENSPQLDRLLSEIDRAASQADKHIQRRDSFVCQAFIFGGTVAEGEPRPVYLDIRRFFGPRGIWNTTFHFLPNTDAPAFCCAEVYCNTSGPRRVVMHLHTVDKLYAADCPEILDNSRKVEGVVRNEHDEPLADAIVSVGRATAPETVQVRTDSAGRFELCLPFTNASIQVSRIGYQTVRLSQPADTTLTVRMKDMTSLKEAKVFF